MDPSDHDKNGPGNGAGGDDGRTHANGRSGENDRWLHSVVENSSEIYTIVDPDGTLRYANPAWGRALGYDPEEAIGTMNVLDHVHPEDLPHVLEETEEALAEGGIITNEAEYRFRRKDGSWRWMQSVGTYLLEDPAVGGVVVVSRDVTERKKAEEALRESEARFRAQYENLPLPTYTWRRVGDDFVLVDHNDAARRYTQGLISDLLGSRAADLLSEWPGYAEMIEDCFRERSTVRREMPWQRPQSGEDRRFVVTCVFVPPDMVMVHTEDITARVEAEQRLSFQAQLLDTVGEAVIALDIDGRVSYWNRAAEDLYGWSSAEVMGSRLREMVVSEDLRGRAEEIMAEVREGNTWTGEFEVRGSDGTLFPVEATNTPVFGEDGTLVGVISVLRDVTKRKETEEALRRSEAEIFSVLESITDGFFALDHELRFTYVNPQAESLFSARREDLIGERVWEDPTFYPNYLRAVTEGETVAFEEYYPPLERWYSVRAYPSGAGLSVYLQDVTERKQAEETLEENETFVRQLLRNLPNGSVNVFDGSLRYLLAEGRGLKDAGFSPEMLVGRTVEEVFGKEGLDLVEGHYRRAFRGEEVRFELPLGGLTYEINAAPLHTDEDGEVRTIIAVAQDVTERKRTEERLGEAEERYRTLVERTPAVTYIDKIDEVSSAIYISPQVEKMLGYSVKEWLEDPEFWIKILHPMDKERVLAEARRTNETGDPFRVEYRMISKSAHVVWVWDEAVLVKDRQGKRSFWQGVLYDITERKQTEAALRESEETFRRSFDDAAIGMALVAPEGRWLQVNRSLCEILGYSEGELLGKTFQDITHPEDLDKDLDNVRRMLAGELHTYQMEKRYLHKEGHVVWVLLSVSLVRDEVGEPRYFVSQMQDVGEHKRAEAALREAEERYRTLVEQIPAVTYVDPVDDPETSLYTSPHIERMLGYTPEEWLNERLWPMRLHQDDRERVLAADERFERGEEERFDEEYRLLAKDGSVVWVSEEAVLVKDDRGKPLYWQGIMHDITARKEVEDALRRSEERYRTVVEEQTELVCRFSPDLILTFVNGAYCRYFGKRPEELVGASFMDHVHGADRGYYEVGLVRLNPESPTTMVEERVFTPGGVRWLQWTDTAIFDAEGRTVEYQSVGRDVTERKAMEERLQSQALQDPLTGLPNRRLFVDRLGQALRRTRREGNLVAVLFMDLDGFKVVNDSLGHETGDLLLTVVAQRLGRCLRPEDTLARFGGDEFVVLLEGVEDPGEAVGVAERIVSELRRPFVLEGRELYATASIGVSWGDARTKSSEDLLRDADTAMYQAKRDGSSYRMFDPDMYERVVRRLELENDLRRAVEEGEFVVHYQPIFDFGSQEPWGVEALVRWDHPERGLLSPSEFVPLAEETGLIVPIGAWVLEEACRRTKGWQDNHLRTPPLGVIVNLSARQLRHPGCEQTIKRALARSGLAADSLSLDVTESAFIDAVEANAQALERIQAMGVRISIDDFGMGYSSLSYLKRLPADALKIDKSFVKGFGKDAEDTAIVRMVIDMAHTLGLEVIAEGVETWSQATLLAETGCDMAQGFHFAEPLPPEAAAQYLNSTHQDAAHRHDPDRLSDS